LSSVPSRFGASLIGTSGAPVRHRLQPHTLRSMRSLRLSKILLVVGFLGVLASSTGWMVAYPHFTAGSWMIDQFAPTIGYGLVGLAWWQWTPAAEAGLVGSTAMRRSSRTLALAAAAFALDNLSQLYGNLRFRYAQHDPGFYLPHFNLENTSLAAAGLGFVLAAVGLWIASTGSHAAEIRKDADLVGSTP
jgi:hypothetical protein